MKWNTIFWICFLCFVAAHFCPFIEIQTSTYGMNCLGLGVLVEGFNTGSPIWQESRIILYELSLYIIFAGVLMLILALFQTSRISKKIYSRLDKLVLNSLFLALVSVLFLLSFRIHNPTCTFIFFSGYYIWIGGALGMLISHRFIKLDHTSDKRLEEHLVN